MDLLYNLSYLHLYYKVLDCERTWNMLQHFGGTLLYLNCERGLCFYPITINHVLKSENFSPSVRMGWYAPTVTSITRIYTPNPGSWYWLLVLRRSRMDNRSFIIENEAPASGAAHMVIWMCWWLGSFLSIAGYSSNSFGGNCDIKPLFRDAKTEELCTWESCYGGTLATRNICRMESLSSVPHDLADYLSGDIDVPLRYLEDVDPPFNFFRVWNDEKWIAVSLKIAGAGELGVNYCVLVREYKLRKGFTWWKKNGVLKRSQW